MKNCNLDTILVLLGFATALILAAIGLAVYWGTAVPLFVAAAFIGAVSIGFIPQIKKALIAYAECRGKTDKCTMSYTIDTLGQASTILSGISFLVAGFLQIAAIALLAIPILDLIGVALEAAVSSLVITGITLCIVTIILLGVILANLYAFKNCMDAVESNYNKDDNKINDKG